MRLRMLKTACGPNGSFTLGRIVDVDPDTGAAWVASGAAEWITPPVTAAAAPAEEIEVAAVEPEVTAAYQYKPRRKK